MDWLSLINASASVATAIALVLTGWQIRLAKKQSQTQFEDDLTHQYREITKDIPTEALLGREISEEEYQQARHAFYRYVDLSNEQVFLRQKGRVSAKTWTLWREGIKYHLTKPAFARAWKEFKRETEGHFKGLQLLEKSGYMDDPHAWDRHRIAVAFIEDKDAS
jgi:hypothetical protein